ncbi:MAG: hypothetical protein CMF41_01205 [Legionellales bacterium]|nr:hypothetical protein [Legionellales bacterium]|tara:strand:+ start:393 stop:806 length:414 start_codon:yes stop_codon:yes gene_type:complete
MSEELYDLYNFEENKRLQSDIIYYIMVSKDTTKLDDMLKQILANKNFSKRFEKVTQRCLSDNSRIAKHGLFFFGLFLCPEFARSLVTPEPKLNPYKFKIFYETVLPKKCNDLLNGNISCLQRFVEEIRTEYIICPIN